jgi:LPPG:FO 2-phospho-L-lactate transferase
VRTERHRVRAAVLRRGQRNRSGGVAEKVERLVTHQRTVGHHHERPVRAALPETLGDRSCMSPPDVDKQIGVRGREGTVRRDHQDSLDGGSRFARSDHVGEHRLDERGPLARGEQRREPALRRGRRIHRDDGEHAREDTRVMRVTVLCGGLGGSRLVDALARAAGPETVVAVGNIGDDLEILGLHVSPDLDTVLYTLAGLLDEERGWGVKDESYAALARVGEVGGETWFTLGDRDIGLHLARTARLREGRSLSAVTAELARAHGLATLLLPASDDPVRTKILTDAGELDFQEWFVARRHQDSVREVRYDGAENAQPGAGVVDAIASADAVVIAPSNPFVSIMPILAVPGVEAALHARGGGVAAVSPLVGGHALRGPLVGMMETLGHEPSALGIARLYTGLTDVFVLDRKDAELAGAVDGLGMRAVVCDTVMVDPSRRADVGRQILRGVIG